MQFVCLLGLSPYELTMGMLVDVSWDPAQVGGGATFPLKVAMTPVDLDTPEIQSNYGFELWAKEFSRPNVFVDYEIENTYTIPNVPDLGLRIRANGVTPLNGQQLWGDDSLDFLNFGDLIPSGDEGTGSGDGGNDVQFPIDIPLSLTGGLRITGDEAKADITVTGMYNSDGTASNLAVIRSIENLRWYRGGTWTIDVGVPATAREGQCLKLSIENLQYLMRMEKRMGMELELFGLTLSTNSLDIWEYVGQWYIPTDLKWNKLEIPIPVTFSAPDLTVSPDDISITFENVPGISGAPHSGDPAVLDRLTAHIKVTNQSSTPLPADPLKKLLTVYVDGMGVASAYLTSGFAGMETRTFTVPFWVMSPGTKTIEVRLNPEQNLGEIFDANNIAERQINVTRKWGSIELQLKDSQGAVLQPGDVLDIDSDGLPRIYATEKYARGESGLYQGSIESGGKVKFVLPAGLYAVFVRTRSTVNYLDTTAEVNLHEATGTVPCVIADIELPVMASVSGTVVDDRTGDPIRPAPPLQGSTSDRPVTASMGLYCTPCNESGQFSFTRIVPGNYVLKIEHPFYYTKEISITLAPGQNLDLGNIRMHRDTVFDTTGHLTLEAAFGGGGGIYTNSRTVKINAWAEDVDGIAGMRFANDGEGWGTVTSSCPSEWTLRDEDGQRSVSVQFKDGAGNWSGVVTASIRLDRQGPAGSVTIDNGNESTTQSNVILTFGATDPAGGIVAAVSLSNDGTNWSVPMPYADTMVWSLSAGYGVRTVYAKFLDACGNWSSVVSDNIQVVPSASIALENTSGMPIATYTNENIVYARVQTGIFAPSPLQTQAFSGDSSASATSAAAQSFIAHSSITVCGAGLVATRNAGTPDGRLRIELRAAPPGATSASSPADSTLVASGVVDSTRLDSSLESSGFVDVTFGSVVTLEANRIYFLVAKAEPYSAGGAFPVFGFRGAWLWPDGNGNVQDAYPDGKLWLASIDSQGTYTWSTLDTENTFPERHDLAFRLMLPADEMRYTASDTIPSSIDTPWGPFVGCVPVALPAGDGRKTVSLQLKHPSYGPTGESEILHASVVKDTSAPEVAWTIPGEYKVIAGRPTIESDSMCLVADARDATSGMKAIKVGLSGAMDSVPWLDYAAFASSNMIYPGRAKLTCALPVSDGQYDICVQAQDTAGNISSTNIPVLKDQFAPSISRLQVTPKAILPDGTPCVSRTDIKVGVGASDSGAGITAYRLGAAQNMSTTWIPVARTAQVDLATTYRLLPGDGLKNVYLQVRDATGKIGCTVRPVYLRTAGPAAPVLAQWAEHPDPTDRQLTATWSACTDPVGVIKYQIEISSDPQFTSVLSAQTFGQSVTSFSWTAPSGSGTYYFRVRAQNAVLFWSEWTVSEGVQILAGTIEDAKVTKDGRPVILSGVVTASFEDCFYIENEDRTSGIRVEPGCGIAVNTRVTVQGTMSTTQDFERVVIGQITSANGTHVVKPLGMTNKALGGGDWRYDPAAQTGQRGVFGGSGPNNIGMLVRIYGRLTPCDDGNFFVDDGSGPVLCRLPKGTEFDPSWEFAGVTGISSCRFDGTHVSRLLRVLEVDPLVNLKGI